MGDKNFMVGIFLNKLVRVGLQETNNFFFRPNNGSYLSEVSPRAVLHS